jgi:hypothetical protein
VEIDRPPVPNFSPLAMRPPFDLKLREGAVPAAR